MTIDIPSVDTFAEFYLLLLPLLPNPRNQCSITPPLSLAPTPGENLTRFPKHRSAPVSSRYLQPFPLDRDEGSLRCTPPFAFFARCYRGYGAFSLQDTRLSRPASLKLRLEEVKPSEAKRLAQGHKDRSLAEGKPAGVASEGSGGQRQAVSGTERRCCGSINRPPNSTLKQTETETL